VGPTRGKNYSAPLSLLNDIPQVVIIIIQEGSFNYYKQVVGFKITFDNFQADKDHDPFAEHKRQTIQERQADNEYLRRAQKRVISPERFDPFLDGRFMSFLFFQ